MGTCRICQERSSFWMHTKVVCLTCDDLLFDLELEDGDYEQESDRAKEKPNEKFKRTQLES